ncbi:MAG: hypothetical protein CL698_00125 [Chloroflexi bacterium]|nr:hypothetical protein [Chloroflexota bacterium]MQG01590.1 hypothetical protein [SAR202 cluster bacterium]
MLKWFIVGAIAVAIILVGSYGRIPFTEISLATSAETQATAVAENTPRKPRSEALFQVRKFLEEECSNGDMYLKNAHRFEAVWMRMPWTNDHHYREGHEWTVTDQLSGAFWRYYEDTGEIVSVKADC